MNSSHGLLPGCPSRASVPLSTLCRALWRALLCRGKPSRCLAGPRPVCLAQKSDLAVTSQILVVNASLMGIMNLEAAQVAEAGGRGLLDLLGHLGECKATRVCGGVAGLIPDHMFLPPTVPDPF